MRTPSPPPLPTPLAEASRYMVTIRQAIGHILPPTLPRTSLPFQGDVAMPMPTHYGNYVCHAALTDSSTACLKARDDTTTRKRQKEQR